ncbi:MAG TPA: MarR family transcriptional regulator [Spirochaetota bacterium]|nr:MarR family transcriptional regulator [Spirochaetota bacterium]HPF07236.1 MarR family transcriptional regulator [Spirochaetota bacterium]HPJ43573.1 MarR family transcriptional regulator [Spirochaetota bacterium]HPR36543.1 MarR family transcriptional regulator [Spirochaetota bacterium]HRX48194.1 MarR family transcriptional regulator [Spirochaetota bacterium]
MYRDRITILPQFVKKVFYDHDISKLGLNINKTQINILMLIDECRNSSMSEISQMTGIEKSSFTRSVDCLEKNGFITRNAIENDRRITKLSLTEKGVKATTLIRNDFDKHLESLISGFSEDEKNEFLISLESISKSMNKILGGKQK